MAHSEALGTVHEVALPAGTIHYRERGAGPPVVFVHGLLVNADLWREVVPSVAEAGLRCIAPDWPMGSHPTAVPHADLSPPGLAALIASFAAVRRDLRRFLRGVEDSYTFIPEDQPKVLSRLIVDFVGTNRATQPT
jgi:pimeloyl-ACP methyl ester carboxylesterase